MRRKIKIRKSFFRIKRLFCTKTHMEFLIQKDKRGIKIRVLHGPI